MNPESVVAAIRELVRAAPAPVVARLASSLLADPAPDLERASRLIREAHPSRLYAQVADEVVGRWKRDAPYLPAAALGGALLAAEPNPPLASGLSLIYTGPATTAVAMRRTDQALVEVIDASRHELLLVSFVTGKLPTVKEAIGRAVDRGVQVRMVLESPDESDWQIAWDGGRGLAERSPNVKVLVWPRERRPVGLTGKVATLHAKFAVADTRSLFVSSANLTDAALAMNLELGVLVEGGPLPRQVRDLVDNLALLGNLAPLDNVYLLEQ